MTTKNERTTISLTGNPLSIAKRALEQNTTALIEPSLSEVVAGIIEDWDRRKSESEAPKRGKKP